MILHKILFPLILMFFTGCAIKGPLCNSPLECTMLPVGVAAYVAILPGAAIGATVQGIENGFKRNSRVSETRIKR